MANSPIIIHPLRASRSGVLECQSEMAGKPKVIFAWAHRKEQSVLQRPAKAFNWPLTEPAEAVRWRKVAICRIRSANGAATIMPSSLQSSTDPAVQTFEAALDARAQAMADACIRCGKCVEICPVTGPGGLTPDEVQDPAAVIGGIIDIVRSGEGNE